MTQSTSVPSVKRTQVGLSQSYYKAEMSYCVAKKLSSLRACLPLSAGVWMSLGSGDASCPSSPGSSPRRDCLGRTTLGVTGEAVTSLPANYFRAKGVGAWLGAEM